jgi:hypothetical protein
MPAMSISVKIDERDNNWSKTRDSEGIDKGQVKEHDEAVDICPNKLLSWGG